MSQLCFFFFFNDTATTEIYTLSLHDALPISALVPAWRLFSGTPILPLKLPTRSGTVTESDPLGSTVPSMLPLPTMGTALGAGIAKAKEESANKVARNTVESSGNCKSLETVADLTIIPRQIRDRNTP